MHGKCLLCSGHTVDRISSLNNGNTRVSVSVDMEDMSASMRAIFLEERCHTCSNKVKSLKPRCQFFIIFTLQQNITTFDMLVNNYCHFPTYRNVPNHI